MEHRISLEVANKTEQVFIQVHESFKKNCIVYKCSEDGSSEVQIGQTQVIGFFTAQLVQPYRDRLNKDHFQFTLSFHQWQILHLRQVTPQTLLLSLEES